MMAGVPHRTNTLQLCLAQEISPFCGFWDYLFEEVVLWPKNLASISQPNITVKSILRSKSLIYIYTSNVIGFFFPLKIASSGFYDKWEENLHKKFKSPQSQNVIFGLLSISESQVGLSCQPFSWNKMLKIQWPTYFNYFPNPCTPSGGRTSYCEMFRERQIKWIWGGRTELGRTG